MAFKAAQGFVEFSAKDKKLQSSLQRIKGSLSKMRASFSKLARKAKIWGMVLGAAFSYSTYKAMAHEDQLKRLEAILKTTGGTAGWTSKQMVKYANSMQKLTGYSNTVLLSSQSIMATFTKIGGETFKKAIEAALNMSTVFGQDLRQACISLGTALNDPIQGVGRLRRIGVSFSEEQKKSIALFMKQNNVMAAQKVILDELEYEIGGAARAARKFGTGPLKAMKNAFSDIIRVFGEAFLPAMKKTFNQITEFLEENEDKVKQWAKTFARHLKLVKDLFIVFAKYMKTDWKDGLTWAFDSVLEIFKALMFSMVQVAKVAGMSAGEAITKGLTHGMKKDKMVKTLIYEKVSKLSKEDQKKWLRRDPKTRKKVKKEAEKDYAKWGAEHEEGGVVENLENAMKNISDIFTKAKEKIDYSMPEKLKEGIDKELEKFEKNAPKRWKTILKDTGDFLLEKIKQMYLKIQANNKKIEDRASLFEMDLPSTLIKKEKTPEEKEADLERAKKAEVDTRSAQEQLVELERQKESRGLSLTGLQSMWDRMATATKDPLERQIKLQQTLVEITKQALIIAQKQLEETKKDNAGQNTQSMKLAFP